MRPHRHGRWLALGIALAMAAPATEGRAATEPEDWLGPAPRDESGRFRNLRNPLPRAGASVALPFFFRRTLGRFRDIPPGLPEQEPDARTRLRERARDGVATVTWINHASVLVRLDGRTFLTDPIWADAAGPGGRLGARRWVRPGLEIEDLPPVDFVLISHNHYDSLDLGSLRALAGLHPETRFLVPLGDAQLLRDAGIERVEEFDWTESLTVGSLTIHCLPSQHWSRRGLLDTRRSLWASWAVVGDSRSFFFGGDSGYFPGFAAIGEALGPFDLAAVPIGAYEPQAMMRPFHMDPEQAVRTGLDLRARFLVAIHFGTFDLTDEPVDEPPRRFRAAARAAGLEDDRVWVLRLGETREF